MEYLFILAMDAIVILNLVYALLPKRSWRYWSGLVVSILCLGICSLLSLLPVVLLPFCIIGLCVIFLLPLGFSLALLISTCGVSILTLSHVGLAAIFFIFHPSTSLFTFDLAFVILAIAIDIFYLLVLYSYPSLPVYTFISKKPLRYGVACILSGILFGLLQIGQSILVSSSLPFFVIVVCIGVFLAWLYFVGFFYLSQMRYQHKQLLEYEMYQNKQLYIQQYVDASTQLHALLHDIKAYFKKEDVDLAMIKRKVEAIDLPASTKDEMYNFMFSKLKLLLKEKDITVKATFGMVHLPLLQEQEYFTLWQNIIRILEQSCQTGSEVDWQSFSTQNSLSIQCIFFPKPNLTPQHLRSSLSFQTIQRIVLQYEGTLTFSNTQPWTISIEIPTDSNSEQ